MTRSDIHHVRKGKTRIYNLPWQQFNPHWGYPWAKREAAQRALPVICTHLSRSRSVPWQSNTDEVESANVEWTRAGEKDNCAGITEPVQIYWAGEDLIAAFLLPGKNKGLLEKPGGTRQPTHLFIHSYCDVSTLLRLCRSCWQKDNRKWENESEEGKKPVAHCWAKGFSGSWGFTVLEAGGFTTHTQAHTHWCYQTP